MRTNIHVLVENTTPSTPLVGEYGLSMQVLIEDKNILFDTGAKDALFTNSQHMGINLADIQDIVISHGHYDHTGALIPFLCKYGGRRVFAHSGIFPPRFVQGNIKDQKNIGCMFSYQQAIDVGAEMIFIDQFTEIYPGVFLTGEIPRVTDYEDVGGNFVVQNRQELLPDRLPDDTAMVIDHRDGLIIISGCSHAGMINTITYALQQTGRSKVLAYIGGTHLIRASDERLEKTIAALKDYDVQKLIVGHCTGFYSAAALCQHLGRDRVIKMNAGLRYRF